LLGPIDDIIPATAAGDLTVERLDNNEEEEEEKGEEGNEIVSPTPPTRKPHWKLSFKGESAKRGRDHGRIEALEASLQAASQRFVAVEEQILRCVRPCLTSLL